MYGEGINCYEGDIAIFNKHTKYMPADVLMENQAKRKCTIHKIQEKDIINDVSEKKAFFHFKLIPIAWRDFILTVQPIRSEFN